LESDKRTLVQQNAGGMGIGHIIRVTSAVFHEEGTVRGMPVCNYDINGE